MYTAIAQMSTLLAILFAYTANEWITEGYGINPFIALPAATLLIALPHILDHFLGE